MFDDNEDMFEDQEDFDQVPESVAQAIEAWQKMMMRKLVEDNFKSLSVKGFSEKQLKEWPQDSINGLIQTFDYMISEFEADEDYEKCAVLVRARQSVANRQAFTPINA